MSAGGTDRTSAQEKLQDALASLSPVAEPQTPPEFLQVVNAAHRIEAEARQLLHRSVLTARQAGATWTEVGKTLGISKQAAQKRFAPPKNLPDQDLNPDERLLGPIGMHNEIEELNLAGRYGWHSVEFGLFYHRVVRSENQWEHCRVSGTKKATELEDRGWIVVGQSFPYTLLKQDKGKRALAEPSRE